METKRPLQLLAFNHVSRICSDLEKSYAFYAEVLGFMPVKRPSSFEFEGAWLFNYGVGLHLIKGCPPTRSSDINPMSCHISFQAASLEEVERCLQSWGLKYVKKVFVEDGIQVGQLFFHDPDNNMIEVCNCDQLPVVPLTEGVLACAGRPRPSASLPLPMMQSALSNDSAAESAATFFASEEDASAHGSSSSFRSSSSCAETVTLMPAGSSSSSITGCGSTAPADFIVSIKDYRSTSSFSTSSVSALTAAFESGCNLTSCCTSELDEWPPAAPPQQPSTASPSHSHSHSHNTAAAAASLTPAYDNTSDAFCDANCCSLPAAQQLQQQQPEPPQHQGRILLDPESRLTRALKDHAAMVTVLAAANGTGRC